MLNAAPRFDSSQALLAGCCIALLVLAACDIAFVDDERPSTLEDATPTPEDEGDATTLPESDATDPANDDIQDPSDETGDESGDGTDALFQRWGTAGSTSTTPRSNDGFGFCGLVDIRQDDIQGGVRETEIPPTPWSEDPVADAEARCGDDYETTAWRLMNCERMTAGIEPVECDLRLVWLGREHSEDMRENNYFSHTGQDGSSPFERMTRRGVSYTTAGENIARYPRVEAASLGWMDSEGHRSNILNSAFSHGAIGISRQSTGGLYLTQLFIRPRSR